MKLKDLRILKILIKIKKAIKGMLPNSPLFRDLMKNNLKLYKNDNHPHESQKPNKIDFKLLNRKNEVNV